jgi:filamentous hemagglutinin family protein
MLTHKFFTLLAISLFAAQAHALPELGHVSQGGANIGAFADHTAIHQVTPKVVINWQSFNIGKKESVHFKQPEGGIALNRINPSMGASHIAGKLTATGKIILMNAAGIHFSPTAVVNVGGIIATTANMTDKNFMAGHFHFSGIPGSTAAIINEGSITAAEHGFSALIAPHVENKGKIAAHIGQIPLYSNTEFVLQFGSNELVHFNVKPEVVKKAIHAGTITADGEHFVVTAHAAKNMLDHAVKQDPNAEAKYVSEHKGGILLGLAPESKATSHLALKKPVEEHQQVNSISRLVASSSNLININEDYFSAPVVSAVPEGYAMVAAELTTHEVDAGFVNIESNAERMAKNQISTADYTASLEHPVVMVENHFSTVDYTASLEHPLGLVENHFAASPPLSPDTIQANESILSLQLEMDNFNLDDATSTSVAPVQPVVKKATEAIKNVGWVELRDTQQPVVEKAAEVKPDAGSAKPGQTQPNPPTALLPIVNNAVRALSSQPERLMNHVIEAPAEILVALPAEAGNVAPAACNLENVSPKLTTDTTPAARPKLPRASIPTHDRVQENTDVSGKIIIHHCIPGEDDEEDSECLKQQMTSAQWSVTWL